MPRTLPWRPPTNIKRSTETVRPIFWSNRPKSYLNRTADWDTFPSGRWGNARSPAYGTLNDYPFMHRHSGSAKRAEKARAAWGASLASLADVEAVFVKYCSGAPFTRLLLGDALCPPSVPRLALPEWEAHNRTRCSSHDMSVYPDPVRAIGLQARSICCHGAKWTHCT